MLQNMTAIELTVAANQSYKKRRRVNRSVESYAAIISSPFFGKLIIDLSRSSCDRFTVNYMGTVFMDYFAGLFFGVFIKLFALDYRPL
jgi:hypothetical protein